MKEKKTLIYNLEYYVGKFKIPLALVCAAVLIGLPFMGTSQYVMNLAIKIGVYVMFGLGLNLLVGYVGLISLGHAGFVAIGAYTCSLLILKAGMNFWLALLLSAVVAALFGVLLGLPTLRLSGSYLSIVTLGFGEIVKTILKNWKDVTGGTLGVKPIPKPTLFGTSMTLANNGLYFIMLFLLLLVTAFCIVAVKSKTGRAFLAIKTDETAAIMMGINVTYYKVLAFVLSGVICAVAGGYYATTMGYIDPNSFTFDTSTTILSIVILGGMGTVRGVFLGSLILTVFPELSRALMDYRFVVYGVILVLMMRFRPQGILGWKSQVPYKLSRRVKKEVEG